MSDLPSAFLRQAISCERLGSPFTGRLCRSAAARLTDKSPIGARLFAWRGDLSSNGQSVPLRFCGALHALKLAGHPALGAVYPPQERDDDALWQAVEAAMEDSAEAINAMLDHAPQTNEVRRSVALIAAGHALTTRFDMPFVAFELGASAGLNLNWSRYALECDAGRLGPEAPMLTLAPDWRGPLPSGPTPQVAKASGVDLNPLDPQQDADRLRAYLWPDQPERARLTDAALAHASPGRVAQSDAIDWLSAQLAPVQGHLRLIYHTIAWQYFPADARSRGAEMIAQAGAETTSESPLVWLSMEADAQGPGAALTARIWPGDMPIALARIDFHGRWIIWQAKPSLAGMW